MWKYGPYKIMDSRGLKFLNVFHLITGVWGQLLYELAGSYSPGQFFFLGSEPVTLQFTSDGSVTYPGFNVRFYMGDKSPGNVMG